jgi:hypothetical protein
MEGTSVCYTGLRDISTSLAYIGKSGRGEVAAISSLFSIHVSKLYKRKNGPCD